MRGFPDSRRLRMIWAALLHILASPKPLSGKRLTEKLSCSRRYLEADLQALVQKGLLESRRGAHGGYQLARNPQRITLLDVVACLDSPGNHGHEEDGDTLLQHVVIPQFNMAHLAVEQVLQKVTLADSLKIAEEKGLLQANLTPDFCI